MKATVLVLAAAAVMAAGTVNADPDAALMKAKGCAGCHELDKKKVGPAFKDVAAKYKADKGAQAMLVAKLKEGKGHMKVKASDEELNKLVGGVLTTK